MSNQVDSPQLSYADLEQLGWPNSLIDEYLSMKRNFTPQRGIEADPNSIYRANFNGMYIDTNLNALWFNPTPGALTGWIAL